MRDRDLSWGYVMKTLNALEFWKQNTQMDPVLRVVME